MDSKCCRMMKARPLLAGMTCRNSKSASNPPAEAPIPTTQGDDSRLLLELTGSRCTAARRGAGLNTRPRLNTHVLVQSPKVRVYVTWSKLGLFTPRFTSTDKQ